MPATKWLLKHGNVKPLKMGLSVERMKSNSIRDNTRTLKREGLLSKYRPLVKHVSRDSERRLWHDTTDNINRPSNLLRALLRECSYLPDSVCGSYIKSYVLSRFRTARSRPSGPTQRPRQQMKYQTIQHGSEEQMAISPPTQENNGPAAVYARTIKLLKDGRTGLRTLQDANRGISEALTRVLFFGYGRIGKRRYELLAPLHIETAGGDDLMVQNANLVGLREERRSGLPSIPPKLEALLKSQKANSKPRVNIKSLNPVISKENSWGHAMPQSRTQNLLIDWYKTRMSKVLPPLPDDEWERIGKIAKGEIRIQGTTTRRVRGGRMPPWFFDEDSQYVETRKIIDSSDMDKLADSLQLQELQDALQGLKQTLSGSPKSAAHNYTPRFMRRRYTELFELCPKLLWDGENQQWKCEWGRIVRKAGNSKRKALADGGELFTLRMAENLELEEGNKRLDKLLTLGSKEHLYGGLKLD